MNAASDACHLCGLSVIDAAMIETADGRRVHPACAGEQLPPEGDDRRKSMLGRLSHWANALGWGQST